MLSYEEKEKLTEELNALIRNSDISDFKISNGVKEGPPNDGYRTFEHDGTKTITIHLINIGRYKNDPK